MPEQYWRGLSEEIRVVITGEELEEILKSLPDTVAWNRDGRFIPDHETADSIYAGIREKLKEKLGPVTPVVVYLHLTGLEQLVLATALKGKRNQTCKHIREMLAWWTIFYVTKAYTRFFYAFDDFFDKETKARCAEMLFEDCPFLKTARMTNARRK